MNYEVHGQGMGAPLKQIAEQLEAETSFNKQLIEQLKEQLKQINESVEIITRETNRDETQERIADALEEIAAVLHDIACTYEERS